MQRGVRRSKESSNDTIYYVSDTTGSLSYTLAETDKSGKVLATYNRAGIWTAGILHLTAMLSVKAFAIVAFGTAVMETIACIVLLISAIVEKDTKEILVYGTLAILSIINLYQTYNICGEILVSGDDGSATIAIVRDANSDWKGSGPEAGVLGINPNSNSNKAIKNYYPKEGGIEFVFDAKTNTFVVGKAKNNSHFLSPHQKLADSIGASHDADTTLGGTFHRGKNGEIITTENSGHFGKNWNDDLRQQFISVMKKYGLEVHHEAWY